VALLTLWSPKGGVGTSVFAAACSLTLAPVHGARLADLTGDQPAVLGIDADPRTGLADWLAAGPGAPTDALDRLAVDVVPGLRLLPRGSGGGALAPVAAAEAGAALAVALRDGPVPTIVDLGRPDTPAARAVLEVSDATVLVMRPCYLALRRAVAHPALNRATGVVLVDEPDRSLNAHEIADVLGRPVLARVAMKPAYARTIDAGILADRLPDGLRRPAARTLEALGLLHGRRGAAA
jgi:hypothetical protein